MAMEFVGPHQIPQLLKDEAVTRVADSKTLAAAISTALTEVATDAETHANDLVAPFSAGKVLAASTDANTVTAPGAHSYPEYPTNWEAQHLPANERFAIFNIPMSTRIVQVATTYGTAQGRMFIRSNPADKFTPWRELDPDRNPAAAANTDLNALTGFNVFQFADWPVDWKAQHYPLRMRGFVFNLPLATVGAQMFITFEDQPRLYLRARSSSTGFLGWNQVGGGSEPAKASGYKVVPLPLTLGNGSGESALSGAVRVPFKFAAPLQRARVHIRNINPRTGAAYAGPVNFTGLWVGAHAGNGDFTGAPSQIAGAFTSPADGSEWVSPWFNLFTTAGQERLLTFGYTATQPVKNTVGFSYWHANPATAADVDMVSGTTSGATPFHIWLEAETYATTPVIGVLGDSLSCGVGAAQPRVQSMLSQYCEQVGALPVHYASSGDRMVEWVDYWAYKWRIYDGLAQPDALIVAIGSNDIFGDTASLATMQANAATVIEQAKHKISPNIYLATIMPRNTHTGATETVRKQYNDWLVAMPVGARDVFNFHSSMSADNETILPEYNADDTHLNAAGYAANAAAIDKPVTTPPVMYAAV